MPALAEWERALLDDVLADLNVRPIVSLTKLPAPVAEPTQLALLVDLTKEFPEPNASVLLDLWTEFRRREPIEWRYIEGRQMFERFYASRTDRSNLWDYETFDWCHSCSEPVWHDDQYTVDGNLTVCDSCINDYYFCESCDSYVRHATYIGHTYYCNDCRSRHFDFCDFCSVWYDGDDADEHDHTPEPCCVSPEPDFAVRIDGGKRNLRADVTHEVSLPAGTIDTAGIDAIASYLERMAEYDAAYLLRNGQVDARWQTREGNFPKRLSRQTYKIYGVRMRTECLAEVGNLARAHSAEGTTYKVQVTRDLNRDASDFGHSGSCWWTCYSESRCALKTNGGFAIRTFDGAYGVTGRAWVQPLKLDGGIDYDGRPTFKPTFDTLDADAYIVFNGYLNLGGYTPSRLVSQMFGLTYRKIHFACSPMYVNNEVGYLVASEELADLFTDGSIRLNFVQHASIYDVERAERMRDIVRANQDADLAIRSFSQMGTSLV